MSSEASAASKRFTVSAEEAGRRLDLYLASHLPEVSRSRIQELIDEGRVRLDDRVPRRSERVAPGDRIDVEVRPRPPLEAAPEAIPIDLLHVDPDFVVVNKAAGMVVHAGAGATKGTLVNALLHRLGTLSSAGGALRPGIVHRLDRGTSGVMLVARNDAAHRALAEQFRARSVHKTYIALVHGRMPRDSGSMVRPISRDPQRRTRMTARLNSGREARTDWRVLLRLGSFTLVAAEPRTGRTHQIRAHFAWAGHPLVGDTLYGAARQVKTNGVLLPELDRVFLHAARLQFAHPTSGEAVDVQAPLPEELQNFLHQLAKATDIEPRAVDAALRAYL